MFNAAIDYLEANGTFSFPDLISAITDEELATVIVDIADGKADIDGLMGNFANLAYYGFQASDVPQTTPKEDIIWATKRMSEIFFLELLMRRGDIFVDRTTYSMFPGSVIIHHDLPE